MKPPTILPHWQSLTLLSHHHHLCSLNHNVLPHCRCHPLWLWVLSPLLSTTPGIMQQSELHQQSPTPTELSRASMPGELHTGIGSQLRVGCASGKCLLPHVPICRRTPHRPLLLLSPTLTSPPTE